MANGGWYGTPEEWERLEAPLLSIDPVLERFASTHGLHLSRNLKDSPERSLAWGIEGRCLIQIYLADETEPTWNVWLCCSEDREDSRYWRNGFVIRELRLCEFEGKLVGILEESYRRLNEWAAKPDELRFATKLAPLPPI